MEVETQNHKHAFMVRASNAKITDEEGNEYEDEDEKEDAKLPSNYKATWRDTEYGLGWLPLGATAPSTAWSTRRRAPRS